MVVDPSKPEKGVFTASFDIPTECACSVQRPLGFPTANDNRNRKTTRGKNSFYRKKHN